MKPEIIITGQPAAQASDYAKVSELDTQLRAVVAERGAIEESWLELAATLD